MNKIFYLTPIVDQDNGGDMMKEERRPLGKPLIRTMATMPLHPDMRGKGLYLHFSEAFGTCNTQLCHIA